MPDRKGLTAVEDGVQGTRHEEASDYKTEERDESKSGGNGPGVKNPDLVTS